ncbi:hypothetical protein BT93_L3465 [Corymbia citriodora subsp. variegata]|uniref:Uncharacterized protein n=1 Tax=Corymbia citriodora subsp. variegata TaxID=360336 RepID=A0A8T0CMG2_CORYI|nr:hypothetical protein BT93_L3465 [Corymbia citriodora subsp. variegata]
MHANSWRENLQTAPRVKGFDFPGKATLFTAEAVTIYLRSPSELRFLPNQTRERCFCDKQRIFFAEFVLLPDHHSLTHWLFQFQVRFSRTPRARLCCFKHSQFENSCYPPEKSLFLDVRRENGFDERRLLGVVIACKSFSLEQLSSFWQNAARAVAQIFSLSHHSC